VLLPSSEIQHLNTVFAYVVQLDKISGLVLMITLKLSYYPWIVQHKSDLEIRSAICLFVNEIQQQWQKSLGSSIRIEVLNPVSVPDQINMIIENECDIALMNPLGFVFARSHQKKVEAIAIALRIINNQVGKTYFAQIFTHKRTAIKKLAQIKGRSMGYGYPYSTSGFIIPAWTLMQEQIHPFTSFPRIEFLGSHEVVAIAVYDGDVDIGTGHDGVIVDLANQRGYGDALDQLVTLKQSAPIPSDPVVVNISDEKLKLNLQKALVQASKTPQGKESIGIFWGNVQGLEIIDSSEYEMLNQCLIDLKLFEKDLITK